MSRADPDIPLSPACMKCEQVTGKSTCFPAPCVFFHERNTPGTKAFNIAELDRVRRGMRETVRSSSDDLRKAIAQAIYDPGATEGYKGERSLTDWQTDAVMRAIAALLPANQGGDK